MVHFADCLVNADNLKSNDCTHILSLLADVFSKITISWKGHYARPGQRAHSQLSSYFRYNSDSTIVIIELMI